MCEKQSEKMGLNREDAKSVVQAIYEVTPEEETKDEIRATKEDDQETDGKSVTHSESRSDSHTSGVYRGTSVSESHGTD